MRLGGGRTIVAFWGFLGYVKPTPGKDGHHADVDEQRGEQRDGALYAEVRDCLTLPGIPGRVNLPARHRPSMPCCRSGPLLYAAQALVSQGAVCRELIGLMHKALVTRSSLAYHWEPQQQAAAG